MNPIVPLLIMALLVGSIAGLFIIASALLGPKKRSRVKDDPFEFLGAHKNGAFPLGFL